MASGIDVSSELRRHCVIIARVRTPSWHMNYFGPFPDLSQEVRPLAEEHVYDLRNMFDVSRAQTLTDRRGYYFIPLTGLGVHLTLPLKLSQTEQ
ncbi:uncharacterized protein V6R79_006622 [Siganus canaliculatus]